MTSSPHYASSIEHPSLQTMQVPTQAPVSTVQQVPQAPQWQGKFALFQSTNPGAKSQWSGRISLPAAEIAAIVHYLQTTPPDQRGNVELWLTGFNNVSKAGLQYIGGYASPMQANQGLAVQHANNQLVQQQHAAYQQGQHYVQPAPMQAHANPNQPSVTPGQPPTSSTPAIGNPPF